MGDEEFVIILPKTGIQERILLEKLEMLLKMLVFMVILTAMMTRLDLLRDLSIAENDK